MTNHMAQGAATSMEDGAFLGRTIGAVVQCKYQQEGSSWHLREDAYASGACEAASLFLEWGNMAVTGRASATVVALGSICGFGVGGVLVPAVTVTITVR
jgi:hypothetical protein